MTLRLAVSLFATLGICFVSSLAFADAKIEIATDQKPMTIYVKDQRVLMKSAEFGEQGEAVFDQRTQTLHVIDHAEKTIFPLNEKTVNELGGTINAAVGVMQQQMEGMSPEQRSQMEKLMGDFGLSVPEKSSQPVITLGDPRSYSYSNIKCDESRVMEGGKELATICVSQGNTTQLSDQDYQSLMSAQTFGLDVARQAKQFAKQFGQQIPDLGDLQLKGLLVNSVQKQPYGDNGGTASFRIKSISTDAVEPITIPTGYRQQSLF